MSENGYRKPRLMQELDVEIWLNDPQDPLEHQISPLFEESWRVYAAIKRCSYGYPHAKAFAVRPRLKLAQDEQGRPRNGTFGDWVKSLHERIAQKGYLTKAELDNEEAERDDDGKLVPLTNKDLALILGTNHANICRGLAVCRERGLVKAGYPFYLEPKPSTGPPDDSGVSTDTELDQFALLATVFGLQVRVSTDTRPEIVQRVRQISTDALRELSELRRKHRTLILGLSTEPGILIGSVRGLKNGSKKGKKASAATAASKSPLSPPPPAETANASAHAKPNGDANGQGAAWVATEIPQTAVAPPDPEARETERLYCQLRAIFQARGKPATAQTHTECLRRFLAEAITTRRDIVQDAALRAELIWERERNLRWVPDLLDYLKSRDWDEHPITRPRQPHRSPIRGKPRWMKWRNDSWPRPKRRSGP